jgi:hypothetical protein
LQNPPCFNNTVAANLSGLHLTLKSMLDLSKPNIYDLLMLHVQARGQLVAEEIEADNVFSVANGTPFDLHNIASEFMKLPILLFTGFLPAHLDSILGEQER